MIDVSQVGDRTVAQRIRQFVSELFGSAMVEHLREELTRVRLDKDKHINDLRTLNNQLVEAMLQTKGITLRPTSIPSTTNPTPPKTIGPTRWEQLQAKAIADNAKAEAEDEKQAGAS